MVTISLALAHRIYADQCREELQEIEEEIVEAPLDMSGASAHGSTSNSMRDTWPGPFMKNPRTGQRYEESELWALAEELVDLVIGRFGRTGEDDWSDSTLPTTPARAFTTWRADKWGSYFSFCN